MDFTLFYLGHTYSIHYVQCTMYSILYSSIKSKTGGKIARWMENLKRTESESRRRRRRRVNAFGRLFPILNDSKFHKRGVKGPKFPAFIVQL